MDADMASETGLMAPPPDLHRCDDCGVKWEREQLTEIKDIEQRIDEGGMVPSGECPDELCGALCYPVDAPVMISRDDLRALVTSAQKRIRHEWDRDLVAVVDRAIEQLDPQPASDFEPLS